LHASVKACDGETTTAQRMHQPWRHRTGLDTDAGILSAMPPHRTLDQFQADGYFFLHNLILTRKHD
jgi:hypothetical protein